MSLHAVQCLIKLGADPLGREVNGDTALHVAVYVDASDDVIRELLHYRTCTEAPDNCCCGVQAVRTCNRKKQYPIEIPAISNRLKRCLLSEGKNALAN